MTLRIGWFTTARGPGSRAMFEAVRDAIEAGAMDAELAFVFCNRERGEAGATDSFFDLVEQAGAPLVARSSVRYRRAVGGALSRPASRCPPGASSTTGWWTRTSRRTPSTSGCSPATC